LEAVRQIIQQETDSIPEQVLILKGGDINQVFHCLLIDKQFVIKLNNSKQFPEMFEKESKGLQLLSQSKFIIPKTKAVGTFEKYDYLILEYIAPSKSINWETFGQNLAHLHLVSSAQFGLDHDNYIGSLKQNNTLENNWFDFYSNNRLLELTSLARDQQLLDRKDCIKIENICGILPEIVPACNPSLLHGDLWSGNLLPATSGAPALIDPAVYYGHPEMDWAMLDLFGSFPVISFEKYQEINPLEKGFEKRKEIHQLYPLLVHLILFGREYYNSVMNIVKKFN
jgi:protein-ribulosamine 3-kinase